MKDLGSSPKILLRIMLSLFAVHLSSAAEADDRTKDRSPDGKFAMLLTDDTEEGRVKVQLIEVSSGKVVLDLAESGHPHAEDCKLLWGPDSQRFAFLRSKPPRWRHHRVFPE